MGMLLIFQALPVKGSHFQSEMSALPSNSSLFGVLKTGLKVFQLPLQTKQRHYISCLFIESFNNRQFGSDSRDPQPKTIKVAVCVVWCCHCSELHRSRRDQGQRISCSITHADSRQTWQTGLSLFSHSLPNWGKFFQWQVSITHFKQTPKAFEYQHGACMSPYRASDTRRPHTWRHLSVSPPSFVLTTPFLQDPYVLMEVRLQTQEDSKK